MALATQYGAHDLRFIGAAGEKDHMLRPVQQRVSKGDTVRLQLLDTIRYHQSLIFLQRRRVRKKGSGVAVWSEPQQDQIEDGIITKHPLDLLLVAFCGLIGGEFPVNAMDVALWNQPACE